MENLTHAKDVLALRARGTRLEVKDHTFLCDMQEVLNRIYGPDRFQIKNIDANEALRQALDEFELLDADEINVMDEHRLSQFLNKAATFLNYQVVIHYPEITIVNSSNHSHKIHDLFVRVFFDVEGKVINTVDGVRTSITPMEINAQYQHSHLPKFYSTKLRFRPFCLGTGPLLATFSSMTERFIKDQFECLCYQINTLVEWESLEGVPHVNMRTIARVPDNTLRPPAHIDPDEIITEFMAKIINHKQDLKRLMRLTTEGDQLVVDFDEELEERVADAIRDVFRDAIPQYWAIRNEAGDYFSVPSNHTMPSPNIDLDATRSILKFKGHEKFIKILNHENFEFKRHPNPIITKALSKHLSKLITGFYAGRVLNSTQAAYHPIRESASTDQISV